MSQDEQIFSTIEDEKADKFASIIRAEVRSADGFVTADDLNRDGMLLTVAQKFIGEVGGFAESDEEEVAGAGDSSGEMIPTVKSRPIATPFRVQ